MKKEIYTKPEVETLYLGTSLNILATLSSFEGDGSVDEWDTTDPEQTIPAG